MVAVVLYYHSDIWISPDCGVLRINDDKPSDCVGVPGSLQPVALDCVFHWRYKDVIMTYTSTSYYIMTLLRTRIPIDVGTTRNRIVVG
jgi:hypothetical protein